MADRDPSEDRMPVGDGGSVGLWLMVQSHALDEVKARHGGRVPDPPAAPPRRTGDVPRAARRRFLECAADLICRLTVWRLRPDRRRGATLAQIRSHRVRLQILLMDYPDMAAWARRDGIHRAWRMGMGRAAPRIGGVRSALLPQKPGWSLGRILDPDFLPTRDRPT